ncbi:hypothetical protein VNO78_11478 [Psophocarpus tetragonolobus]|uniref:Uncharacterized protein n=1 Tax=Psophocarpus tetragonolobus TaxID=3891 RepID=A0AAN9SLH4_PSOTE
MQRYKEAGPSLDTICLRIIKAEPFFEFCNLMRMRRLSMAAISDLILEPNLVVEENGNMGPDSGFHYRSMVTQTGSQETKHHMQAGKKLDESNLPPNRATT